MFSAFIFKCGYYLNFLLIMTAWPFVFGLCVWKSIYLPFVSLFAIMICLAVRLSVRPFVAPSVRLCRSVCSSVRLVCQFVYLPVCLSVRPCVCLSFCLSLFLPVCPSVRLPVIQSGLSRAKLRAGHIYMARKISHDVTCNCLFVYYLSLPFFNLQVFGVKQDWNSSGGRLFKPY